MGASPLHDHTGKGSSGRTIAIWMALVIGICLLIAAFQGRAFGIPETIMTIAAIVAIPLVKKFESDQGAELIGKLIDKIGIGPLGVNADPETAKASMKQIGDAVKAVVASDSKEDTSSTAGSES